MTATPPNVFAIVYHPELTQYVVERGDMRVVPSVSNLSRAIDPQGVERAREVCEVLNRVYARE